MARFLWPRLCDTRGDMAGEADAWVRSACTALTTTAPEGALDLDGTPPDAIDDGQIDGTVILGGTKLTGGTGTVAGSVIGAIFLVLIDNGLNLLNASPYIYDIVRGGVLLAAVAVDRVSAVRQQVRLDEQRAAHVR